MFTHPITARYGLTLLVALGVASAGCSGGAPGVSGSSGSESSSEASGGGVGGGNGAGGAGAAGSGGAGGTAGTGGEAGDGGLPPQGFQHPGILVNKAQLDFVKSKVAASTEPWKSAFTAASNSSAGSLNYKPAAIATVVCGPYSNPDIGCSAEKSDATAAYTHALLWALTGEEAHAKKAIEIMNAWSLVLKDHTNSNAPLQSAWVGSVFPRAAEIIRYTYNGWPQAEVDRFSVMLKTVYLPKVINGSNSNGNWELSMAEASTAIGVFLDDKVTFDKAMSLWRKRVPAYVYLTKDGPLPVPPPTGNATTKAQLIQFWYNQSTFVDGLSQETCRDLGHVQYGLAAIINAAETARIQGVDLYSEQATRIEAGLEFHANFLDGAAVPSWLCPDPATMKGNLNAVTPDAMWEIGYNEFANRLGASLPKTQKLLTKIRPTDADHHMDWETLTHAEVGSAGLP